MKLATFGFISFLCLSIAGCSQSDQSEESFQHSQEPLQAAQFSQNGELVIVAPLNQMAILWDVQSQEPLYYWSHQQGQAGTIVHTALSPDGSIAVTAEPDNIVLWETKTGQSKGFWQFPSKIKAMDVSNEGEFVLVSLRNRETYYIDFKQGYIPLTFKHNYPVNSIEISHDGKLALSGADDAMARLWNLEKGEVTHEWTHNKPVTHVNLSPDQKTALTNAAHEKAIIWDVESGESLIELAHKSLTITASAFSPQGDLLATGSPSGIIQLWDLSNGKKLKQWRLAKPMMAKPSALVIQTIAFSPEGDYLITEDSSGRSNQWLLTD